MGRKDFFWLEDQIRHTLENTLENTFDAIEYAKSKEHYVKSKLRDKVEYFDEKLNDKVYDQVNRHHHRTRDKDKYKDKYADIATADPSDINSIRKYVSKKPVGRVSGILYVVFGSMGSATLGVVLIAYLVFCLVKSFTTVRYLALAAIAFFFVSSIGMLFRGINLRKRIKRFKGYVKALNNKSYCSIEEIAKTTNMKQNFVIKDLRRMISLGMFKQAHIDEKQTYFMISDEVYQNYLSMQEELNKRKEEELKRQEKIKEEMNDPDKKELRTALELGKNYIDQIKVANDAIEGEEISEKLFRLEKIVNEIFNYLESNPEKLREVNKFMNHYLPITLKLVNSYKDLNDLPVQGDNIKNAKNEIEKSLDLINVAFEKMLDDLFGKMAMDISTDISVLETLFSQEGLTKDDLKKQ
ncbi:5-bromo-4-chloroindolyl phosphate hydrolysis family protein [Clostridium cellulovorans]|uniref:5-bromo-4-chloroindolyl phosphate hydrolysis protein n=1 Tax=Clostridium cellulovorans (strain ATCC 35296 / DSM 3052 / OCM 3 / 743B) TaxID=573061 RepID=D9STR3_CLOC7|nr:5-bromo-4-chloroindolyl phosphate hydrolysis family protein [Clostridium cellulovorans]ADL52797.1 hypothetical protein Clocel_3107 [Clostridium cellulovorans 743B]